MYLSNTKPPIWEEAQKAFNFEDDKPIFFSFGNIIYNPNNAHLSADLLRHEETHMEQQMHSPEVAMIWWRRYIADPVFRMEQEGEAFGAQYAFICQSVKDPNYRYKNLVALAQAMSAPLYGGVISVNEAIIKIREYAGLGRYIAGKF